MAYQRSWNESAPPGTLPADQIDTAIQDTKIALRERLNQVIPGFGSDSVNPKRARAIYSGTLQNRPIVEQDGVIYVATDEGRVYFSGATGAWNPWPTASGGATLLRGAEAELPSPAETDFYFAVDTEKLFVSDGADPPEFVAISGEGGGGGTEIEDVAFDQMRGARLSHEEVFNNVPATGSGALGQGFDVSFGALAGLSLDHVIIGIKYRIWRNPGPPGAPARWGQWTNIFTTGGGVLNVHAIGSEAIDNVSMVVGMVGLANVAGDTVVAVTGFLRNGNASAVDVRVQFDCFVLAATAP